MITQALSNQFILFLLVGGFAAAINFLSRIIYDTWLNYTTAIILAYITGMITAYILSRLLVFANTTQTLRKSVGYFILVNLVAALQTWAVSIALAFYLLPFFGITKLAPEIAHAVGILIPVFTSYLGHKHLSFKS